MDKARVLVFGDKRTPDAIIPVEELRTRPQVWKNVRVLVAAQHKGVINLRFTDDEYEMIEDIANDSKQSVYHWCKIRILKQLATDMGYKYPDEAQIGRERKLSERRHKDHPHKI